MTAQNRVNNMASMVAIYQEDFSGVLTDQALSWQKECQFAEQALSSNNVLATAAKNNPHTLRAAIINIAAIGISLNPALKHAYLVPRKGEVCLDISYQGLLHLAQKEGAIVWGQAKLVREKDTYINMGADQQPQHEYNAFAERGNVIGAYCTVKLPSGDYLTEEMSYAEIDYVAKTSAGYASDWSPWKKWRDQMTRKTVIKRASNYWPKSYKVLEAVHVLNEHEGLAAEHLIKDVQEAPPTNSTTLNELLEPEAVEDFESRLNGAKDQKELTKVAADIASSGKRTDELLQLFYKRRGELA